MHFTQFPLKLLGKCTQYISTHYTREWGKSLVVATAEARLMDVNTGLIPILLMGGMDDIGRNEI